jgi:ABC-2 type transport system permease protein
MAKRPNKLLVIFKREYLERVRSKWFLVATILGPLFFAAITVVPIVMAAKTRLSTDLADIIIIDGTGTDLGQRVATSLHNAAPSGPPPLVQSVSSAQLDSAEEAATAAVVRRETRGYLVLDEQVLAGRQLRYAGRNASQMAEVNTIERTVRQALLAQRLEREGINAERVSMLTAVRFDMQTEKISDKGREGSGGMASFFFGYAIAFILYIMIAIYGQNILRGVMEEKTTRVAEVVISSAPASRLLAGKVLGVGSVALTQVFAWMGMGYLFYTLRSPIVERLAGPEAAAAAGFRIPAVDPAIAVVLLLFFVLGFIFYAALHAAVGAMVSSQEDVQQASMPVMLLLISSIIFMQPVLMNPGTTLAKVVSWLPFSAPIMMPLRMSLISIPWWEITASLLGVALSCAIAIWLSAKIYRVGLLMHGKRPSYGELMKWIRYS